MKKLAAIAAAQTASAVFALAPDGMNVLPEIHVLDTLHNTMTIRLICGEQPTTTGFDIVWWGEDDVPHTISFNTLEPHCTRYALQPGQKVNFRINGWDSDECHFNYQPERFECGQRYRLVAVLHDWNTSSNQVATEMERCQ